MIENAEDKEIRTGDLSDFDGSGVMVRGFPTPDLVPRVSTPASNKSRTGLETLQTGPGLGKTGPSRSPDGSGFPNPEPGSPGF